MIDLHIHSNCSDGTKSPEEIITEAIEKKIEAISITDHDTAKSARILIDKEIPIEFIPGIELSIQYNEKLRFHLIGLFIDPNSKETFEIENLQVKLREERNLKIYEKLKDLNYDISFEEVKKEARITVGRMHFANCLVKKGYFKEPNEAIEALLKPNKSAFVERKRLSAIEGIERIKKMKGISIIAHIGKELNDFEKIFEILKRLKDNGLDGLEVYHSDHNLKIIRELKKIAKELSLAISGGSDYHGLNKKSVEIGVGRGNLRIPYKIYLRLKEYWSKNFSI